MRGQDITKQVIRQLSSPLEKERLKAERLIESWGPAGLNAVLYVLAAEHRTLRTKRWLLFVMLLVLVAMYYAHAALPWFPRWIHIAPFNFIQVLIYLPGIFFFTTIAQDSALKILMRYDDVKATGAFADALRLNSPGLRRAARSRLTVLLPQMRASDAPLLNDTQRATLNRQMIRKRANPDLVRAILLAWQQVGDKAALPFVEELAARRNGNPDIRQAAQDCLPFLTQRIAEQDATSTLLRAAGSSCASPETLLRPAAAGGSVPHINELLRATAPDAGRLFGGQTAPAAQSETVEIRQK